jgi:hypothetical protein
LDEGKAIQGSGVEKAVSIELTAENLPSRAQDCLEASGS